MIITISGTEGSGKSSVAKLLAIKLGYKHYSVGDYRRDVALRRGLNINELNKLGEKDFSTDKEPDEWQTQLGKTEDNFVIDGRLSYHFIPNSFKLFLDADIKVRAERIFNDKRKSEKYKSVQDTINKITARNKNDISRYKKYYKLNPFEENNYDLVIDTSKLTIEDVVGLVMKKIKEKGLPQPS